MIQRNYIQIQRRTLWGLGLAACLVLGGAVAQAQVQPITGIAVTFDTITNSSDNYSATGGGSGDFPATTTYDVRFNDGTSNLMQLEAVSVGALTFDFAWLAQKINIARSTHAAITGLHHIVLYEQSVRSGTNVFLKTPYQPTMEGALRSKIINQGADNVFANQGDGNGNNNNIERIDYIFSDGFPAYNHMDQRGFLVMDRGGNDRFKIAAITALDGNGLPTAFGTPISVMESNWGASGRTLDTIVMRGYTENGDVQHPSADVDPQPLSGVFVSWQALGLRTNDLFYGYALAANDSTTNGANWNQVDNTAYFPVDTSPGSTYGGLDLISGGAVFFDHALDSELGDRVWDDWNRNGVQDVSEPGISNVLVKVYDNSTNLTSIVRTDENGAWMASGLGPGSFFAEFTPPASYQFTMPSVGSDTTVDSDANLTSGRSGFVTLSTSQTNLTIDAGLYRSATIGNFTWVDTNGNGQQDAGEPGLPNVTVRLYNAASNVIGTTTSSTSGAYAFTNLMPGTYFVGFTAPAGYLLTTPNVGSDLTDSDPLAGTYRTVAFALGSGEINTTVDAGFYQSSSSIGDFVWRDVNVDGIQSGGSETGMPNVVVRLYGAASNLVASTTTSAAGAYNFTNLPPATYFLEFVAPSGFTFTLQDRGGNDTLDSDVAIASGRTSQFYLPLGTSDLHWDAGLSEVINGLTISKVSDATSCLSPGDTITYTVTVLNTGNVEQVDVAVTDTLPPGLTYVTDSAQAGDVNTTLNTVRDEFNNVAYDNQDGNQNWFVDWQENDSYGTVGPSGNYVGISGERLMLYYAYVGDEMAWRWADLSAETNATLSFDWETVSLDAGEYMDVQIATTPDGTYVQLAHLGGTASGSTNFDITAYISTSTTVRVLASPGTENWESDDYGYLDNIEFSSIRSSITTNPVAAPPLMVSNQTLPAGGTLQVTFQATVDTPSTVTQLLNIASTYSGVKPPIQASVTNCVVFADVGVEKWVTDSTPDMLEAIEYTLVASNNGPNTAMGVVITDVLPPQVQYNNHSNGTYNSTSGEWTLGTLAVGASTTLYVNVTVDAGTVGQFITNTATVTGRDLYDPVSSNDTSFVVIVPEDWATLGDRVWFDEDGDGVQAGGSETGMPGVVVRLYGAASNLVDSTTTSGTGAYSFTSLPSGSYFLEFVTPTNHVASPQDQGGNDELDSDISPATGRTALFTLSGGENDTSRDAGFYQPPSSIGDWVWNDVNTDGLQSGGSETGMPSVVVNLYGAASNLVATTTTSASGAYSFTNLLMATYFMEFTAPSGFTFTLRNGGDDLTDSDVDPATGRTSLFMLPPGTNDLRWDAGLSEIVSGLSITKSSDALSCLSPGDTITYTVTVENTGTVTQTGVALVDALPAGLTVVPGSAEFVAANMSVRTVRDEFNAVSWSNQDGTENWAVDWQENDPYGSDTPSGNYVGISGGRLMLYWAYVGDEMAWRWVDLSDETNATLTFDWETIGLDANEYMDVQIATTPAGPYVQLAQFGGSDSGSTTLDVTSYISTSTTLRVLASPGTDNWDSGEYGYVDNIEFSSVHSSMVTNPASNPPLMVSDQILVAGGTLTLTYQAVVDTPSTVTQLLNVATTYSAVHPPISASVTDCVVFADVGVVKVVSDSTPDMLDTIQYTLVASNNGPAVATGVVITDLLPPQVQYTSHSGGTYSDVSGEWAIGTLDINASTTLVMNVTVQDGTGGLSITNTATVTGRDLFDPESDNDTSSVVIVPNEWASVGDQAWIDADGNGVQDGGESGLASVTVRLYGAATNLISSTLSGVDGTYAFTNLSTGSYFLEFDPPAGYHATVQDQGGDDALDSDILPATDRTAMFSLSAGTDDVTWDAGFYRPATVGDRIWFDSTRDGIQYEFETNGLAGVTVDLQLPSGQVVATTSTDSSGYYQFTDIVAGTYVARFDLSDLTDDYSISPANQGGDDTVDSDATSGGTGGYASTDPFSVAAGEANLTIDLGVRLQPGTTRASVAEVWGEGAGDGVCRVVWQTSSEWGTAGFFVYRMNPETGEETRLNDLLIPSAFQPSGSRYNLVDPEARPEDEGTYRLEEVELSGATLDLGTHEIRFDEPRSVVTSAKALKTLRSVARSVPALPDPSPVLKVHVQQEGLYGVAWSAIAEGMGLTQEEVQALAEAGSLRITESGVPVSAIVDEVRNRLLFHATSPVRDWYTRDRAYLISEGEGLAMLRREPGATSGETVFPVTIHFEEDRFLFSMTHMPEDFYFWAGVVSSPSDQFAAHLPLDLSGTAGGDVSLKVRLMGWSSTTNDPDHLAEFSFNGTLVGSVTFDNQDEVEAVLTIPSALVVDGENMLKVSGVMQPGHSHSFFVVDWVEASFGRNLTPLSIPAELGIGKAASVSAAAFVDPLAVALDEAGNPTWIAEEQGSLSAKAWAVTSTDERFAVLEADAVPMLVPEPAAADAWFLSASNQIDYLVIASRALAPAAQELADYRSGQGLRSGVAVFEDVCDLMADGQRTPQAIANLLRYASDTWARSPQMVVLAGNGNYDTLGTQSAEVNHLPPMLIQAPGGICASDALLADTGGDSLPDLAIGRLPALTSADLTAMIAKIKAYESGFGSEWQNELVLVADQTDPSAGDFSAANSRLGELATAPYSVVDRIDLDQVDIKTAREDLLSWFHTGVGFIQYTGHGGINTLSALNLLKASDVESMNNATRLPVTVSLSCLVGLYEVPAVDSLGELLMRNASGGAVAVLGPSGLSRNAPATELGEAFYQSIFQDGEGRLGLAFLKARRALPDSLFTRETVAVYNLLGDPALRIAGNESTLVEPAPAILSLHNLAQSYNGHSCAVSATTEPSGLSVRITYDGSLTPPVDPGTYDVTATVTTAGYEGLVSDTLVISKGTASITLGDMLQTYDGGAKTLSIQTQPSGLAVDLTVDGSTTAPVAAGSYAITATVLDERYEGSFVDTLVIAKADAAVELDHLAQTFDGSTQHVTVLTEPEGLAVEVTYGDSETLPTDAGTYSVVAAVQDDNWQGVAVGELVISKAQAAIELSGLEQVYDGTAHVVTATTLPEGLAVSLTYDGGTMAPAGADTYSVIAAVNNPNWSGTASGTLRVSKGTQHILFPSIPDQVSSDSLDLAATADSGLPVCFQIGSGPAVLSGDEVSFTGSGTVEVTASQSGDLNWNAALDQTLVFQVLPPPAVLEISQSSIPVREGGEARFFIRLDHEPDADTEVQIDWSGGDPMLQVLSGASLVFDRSNWNDWQAVTLTAPLDVNSNEETASFQISALGVKHQEITAYTLDSEIGDNLALESSGASIKGGHLISEVIDGIHSEISNYGYLDTETTPPESMVLDLKMPRALTRMRLLNWNWMYRTHRYTVEASMDGVAWSILVDARNEDHQGWDDWEINVTARYLRLTGLSNSANDLVCIPEWEVYGTSDMPQVVLSKRDVPVRENGEGRFFVSLDKEPAENMTVTVSSGGEDADLSILSGEELVFTPANWSDRQAVTLTASDDEDAVNGSATFQVVLPGVPSMAVTAIELDDDIGENLALASVGSTIRGGSRASRAIDGIHTNLSNYGYMDASDLPPGSMTLDLKQPAELSHIRILNWDWNWRVHQYTIESSLDGVSWIMLADASTGDHQGWEDWAVAGSARFLRFTALSNSANRLVCVPEWEVYGTRITLSSESVNVQENGEGRFFVKLSGKPVVPTTVTVARASGGDADLTLQGTDPLVFTPANWSTWQKVTVVAAADEDTASGSAVFHMTLPELGSRTITATELDNDVGVNLALASRGTTVKGRGRTSCTIDGVHTLISNYGYLDSSSTPQGSMQMDLKSSLPVTRIRLLNWDWGYRTHQYIIEASQDGATWSMLVDASDGEHQGWEDWDVSSTVRYLRLTARSNSVNSLVCIPEWEVYGELEPPQLELSTAEVNVRENGEGRFFVKLSSVPAQAMALTVTSGDGDSDLTVQSGASLFFTPSNWDDWQAVTFSAADDPDATDGTMAFQVALAGGASQVITATELDDDIGENLALASAGSSISGGHRISCTIDGVHNLNSNYGYLDASAAPQESMILDLRVSKVLSRVRLLNWNWTFRVHRYTIEASVDGTSWSMLVDASAEDRQGWDDWPVDTTARYLRFTALSNSANRLVCIPEWEVFGESPAARARSVAGAAPTTVPDAIEPDGIELTVSYPWPVTVVTSDDAPDHTNGWAAVDGDEDTAWKGLRTGSGYIVVGYETPIELSLLEVDLGEESLTDFDVLYSLDAQNWFPLEEEDGPVTLTYLWLIFSDVGTSAVPEVLEIRPVP